MTLLPATTTAWIIWDGKIGDKVLCLGVAEAMGLAPQFKLVAPGALWATLAPFGPIDPRDRPAKPDSPIAAPFPDILLAACRRSVPYLRHVKRASNRRTFTIFLKNPTTGRGTADVIWVPEHDELRGDNVIVTLTSPHVLTAEKFALARAAPDPRIAQLCRPRVAMVLGGTSEHYRYNAEDERRLTGIAVQLANAGNSLMVTPSRRTPPGLVAAIRATLAASQRPGPPAFVWNGQGDNPYLAMLANADHILVTSDSINMVGEAAASRASVYVYEPSGGGHRKISRFIDRLVADGAVRRFSGSLDGFARQPLDATPTIGGEIVRRYRAFRDEGK